MKDNNDKNIYNMLNDIEVDLSEYEREDFNDIEKIKIKKKFRQSIGKKNTNSNYKKYISVASVAILSIAIVSVTPLGTYASKMISDLVFDIKSVLNLEVDDGNYIKVINQSITKDDVTLRLNEAVLNDGELIVSMTTKSKEKIPRDIRIEGELKQKLYINGEFIDNANSSSGIDASKKNIDEVLFFNVDTSKYSSVIDIKIELEDLTIYREINNQLIKEKTVKGPFVFEFDFDTSKISKNIKNVDMNKEIDLGNNQKISLDKFVYTPLTQKVYYTKNKEEFNNEIELVLKGVDELGNEVIFERNIEGNGTGTLITNLSGKQVDKSAKYLTLTAYKRSYIFKEDGGTEQKLEEIEKDIKIDLTTVSK
ncbi:DUF4179 domain-containing protein [Romboutsia sp.]|uniref:DUF4179 domain-containing protein n=1 Tax=Romboutsia sp. TaxID=1965302 RepID=UPI003F3E9791